MENPGTCGACGSLGSHDFVPFEDHRNARRISETVTCADCGASWSNTYVLAGQEAVDG